MPYLYPQIGEMLSMALQCYEQGSRRTGRTTALVQALEPQHVVVCANEGDARNLREQLKDAGKSNAVVVAPYPHHEEVMRMSGRRGFIHDHLVFDHGWVRGYWEFQVRSANQIFRGMVQR